MAHSFGDYYSNMLKDKLIQMPIQDEVPLNSTVVLLDKRRELAEVEAALAAQKEESKVKMKLIEQRREELNKKEEELKKSFAKFDKFLRENDAKQSRARSKISIETELTKQKEKDISRLNNELDDLIIKRNRLKKKVESYAVYPKFLEKVIKMSKEFQDIRMVNIRFETLFVTHNLLLTKYHEDQEIIKTLKSNHNNIMKEKENEIMMYHNALAALTHQLEAAKAKTIKGESVWAHIQNTAAKRTLVLGMTKMAIFNLYMHVRKAEMKLGTLAEDTDIQLQAVQQNILELRDTVNELKKGLEIS
ncbi:coiled-coil domain-containing protein 42 homolog isoform X1 [Stegostoma tigrinum]|uniref:coiled-coil domain-containing protein 42 homolog isoform X1 n=1 Tax=Stegostoma tigrinum TaxID=3053191 RepID=UPI00202ADFB6|nr:coiled-coil domain-containing protein 42 homolog isoform X1 [Stegostoma tigrinum]